MRSIAGVVFLGLALSSCGAPDEGVGQTPQSVVVSVPEESRSAAPVDDQSTTVDSTVDTAASTMTTVPPRVTPALGIEISASDTFDASGLQLGQTNFVPLDDPVMVAAADVTWLDEGAIVMGVVHENGETHAYPVDQMAYHHIANTTVAGEPFLVTY